MAAYYNEIDPFAAQWLRELIAKDLIAPGIVDERDIRDVKPDELKDYRQCHFFAGIGVWSYALRRARVADDREVWTGSCPCQPFSAAGKGGGFADERHLWPAFHHLIRSRRPQLVLGEQVASKDGLAWLDLVQTDLEGTQYTSAAVDLCAAGVGAPHIRQRLWWVAYGPGARLEGATGAQLQGRSGGLASRAAAGNLAHHHQGFEGREVLPECAVERATRQGGVACCLADADADGGDAGAERQQCGRQQRQQPQDCRTGELGNASRQSRQRDAGSFSCAQKEIECQGQRADGRGYIGLEHAGAGAGVGQLANTAPSRRREECEVVAGVVGGNCAEGIAAGLGASGGDLRPGPTNGFWRDADWLFCRDGKWRPVEPGTFPLAHGSPARVGRLRGYGNAINAEAATAFIQACLEC